MLSNEVIKTIWLDAYRQTAKEYAEQRHELHCFHCAKCQATETIYTYLALCQYCPEGCQEESEGFKNCGARICRPYDSETIYTKFSHRLAVLKYHEEAIKYLNTVSPITFANHIEVIQKHLKEIDLKVAKEFNLI